MHEFGRFSRLGAYRIGLTMGLIGLGVLIIRPFLPSLIWAMIFTILCLPIHDWLLLRLPNQKSLIPLVVLIIGIGLVAGPLWWVMVQFQTELSLAYQLSSEGIPPKAFEIRESLRVSPILGPLINEMVGLIPSEAHDLISAFKKNLPWLGRGIRSLLIGLSDQILQLFITGFALYFFLRDGDRVMIQIRAGLYPLMGKDLDSYLNIITHTVKAVSFGIFGSAMIQGLIATIGYLIFGLKTPVLLGLLSAIFSLVPVVGSFLIWGPLVLLFIFQNQMGVALGLALWGLLVVHPADNILRPWVIGSMLHAPILIIVLGVVGGALSLGLIGVFVGPCTLAMLLHTWSMWIKKKGLN